MLMIYRELHFQKLKIYTLFINMHISINICKLYSITDVQERMI